jgi:hypothetical protein
METSASFEARYAPLPYPTNQVPTLGFKSNRGDLRATPTGFSHSMKHTPALSVRLNFEKLSILPVFAGKMTNAWQTGPCNRRVTVFRVLGVLIVTGVI